MFLHNIFHHLSHCESVIWVNNALYIPSRLLTMRLFIAVDLASELKAKIEATQKQIAEPALSLVLAVNLHTTLKFLGEVPDNEVEDIIAKLALVNMKPFEVEYRDAGVFPSVKHARVVWIGIHGSVDILAGKVKEALPMYPDDYPFKAHLTVARVRSQPERLNDNLQRLADYYIGKQTVDRFVLKKSVLRKGGLVYEDVKIFRLC